MKIRPLSALSIAALSAVVLVGCSATPSASTFVHDAESDATLTVDFSVVGADDEPITSDTVTVQGEDVVAMDLMEWYLAENEIAFEEENGMVQVISDLESDGSEGWLMWVDDELAETGADALELEDGQSIEWRYVTYDEVFAE